MIINHNTKKREQKSISEEYQQFLTIEFVQHDIAPPRSHITLTIIV